MTPIMSITANTPSRRKRVIDITVDEKPTRTTHVITNYRARDKFIKTCERYIRSSNEYREYINFIKREMRMDACYVNPTIRSANGKKYRIELHHEPFTLYDLVDIEIARREMEMEPLTLSQICENVMELHYAGLVGLIPLSKTQHQLIDCNKLFIPLQHIYQDFYKYYEMFADVIESEQCQHIKKKIDTKVQLSLLCGDIQSDVNNPEFIYLNVDGFKIPEIPEDWKYAASLSTETLAKEEAQKEKESKKKKKKDKEESEVPTETPSKE